MTGGQCGGTAGSGHRGLGWADYARDGRAVWSQDIRWAARAEGNGQCWGARGREHAVGTEARMNGQCWRRTVRGRGKARTRGAGRSQRARAGQVQPGGKWAAQARASGVQPRPPGAPLEATQLGSFFSLICHWTRGHRATRSAGSAACRSASRRPPQPTLPVLSTARRGLEEGTHSRGHTPHSTYIAHIRSTHSTYST